MIDETNDGCPLLKVSTLGALITSITGRSEALFKKWQPLWAAEVGVLGKWWISFSQIPKIQKRKRFPIPPQQVEVDEILEGGKISNFQQIHTAFFRHLQCSHHAGAQCPSQTWKIILAESGARGALLSSVLCPPASERATKPPPEISGEIDGKLCGFWTGGRLFLFLASFWNLVVLFLMKLFNLPNFKDFFQVRYHEDVPILYFAEEVQKQLF